MRKQYVLNASARELAVLGATLADGGVNPIPLTNRLKYYSLICTIWVGLTAATSRAAGPDYLTSDCEPADQASQLLTPFTPLTVPEPQAGLFGFTNEPFIRDADFSVDPRFYFRSLQNSSGVNNTFAGGGLLGLTTGWWRDTLQLGVAGYTTQPLVNNQNGIDRTGLVAPDGDGFFVLGQAWTKLKAGPATATLFRQELELPFIHGDDVRMIPNTFEAYQIDVKPDEIVRLNFGYVARIKTWTSEDFVSMSEAAGAPQVNRGTSFAGLVLGSEAGTYLGAMSELTWDLFSCSYVQAGHTYKVTPDFELRGDVQFVDQRSVGDDLIGSFETQLYGGQLAASYGGAVLSLAYTDTARGAGIIGPFGAGPEFNGRMLSGFASAGEQAYGVGLSYNFAKIGLTGVTAFASYVYGTLPADSWEQEINATVDYRISAGPLKNIWLRLRYARLDPSGQVSTDDFRVILNYSLTF